MGRCRKPIVLVRLTEMWCYRGQMEADGGAETPQVVASRVGGGIGSIPLVVGSEQVTTVLFHYSAI